MEKEMITPNHPYGRISRERQNPPRIIQVTTTKRSTGHVEHIAIPFEGDLSGKVQLVLTKIRVLRTYTKDTGFRTTRSQNDLLQTLDGEELANALLVLSLEKSDTPKAVRHE
jgi:hypothetical protein